MPQTPSSAPARPPRSEAAGRLIPDADRQALRLRLLAVAAHASRCPTPAPK